MIILKAHPRVRRQHGVAAYTPRTIAIYRPSRLMEIPVPTRWEWVRFFATCGTDWEFFCELVSYAVSQGLDASRYAPVAHLARAQPFIYLG